MSKNESGFRYGERLADALAKPVAALKAPSIRDRDAMPDDPEALIEWGKRNIQSEPANEFERRRGMPKPRITYLWNIVIILP